MPTKKIILAGLGPHARRPSASNFVAHPLTNKLLAKVYECIVRENSGGIPHLTFELDNGRVLNVCDF